MQQDPKPKQNTPFIVSVHQHITNNGKFQDKTEPGYQRRPEIKRGNPGPQSI